MPVVSSLFDETELRPIGDAVVGDPKLSHDEPPHLIKVCGTRRTGAVCEPRLVPLFQRWLQPLINLWQAMIFLEGTVLQGGERLGAAQLEAVSIHKVIREGRSQVAGHTTTERGQRNASGGRAECSVQPV